ncbi:MAG: MlaD family protein, partial [Candidatus Cloacimonetes bacterium]|nr:MlaD family protein [Candidatus Cloacimonadota bacterium]
SQQHLKVCFEDVMGLELGDPVYYRGMEVGRVKYIELRADYILVTANIDKDIKLKEGTRFQISDTSVMGGTALNIIPGNGATNLNLHHILKGEKPLGIMNAFGEASVALAKVNETLVELEGGKTIIDKTTTLLDDVDSAARSADIMINETRTNLNDTLGKIDQLSRKLQNILDNNAANLDSTLTIAPAAIANINNTLDSIKVLSTQLHSTLDDLNQGKGSAGKFLKDETLYKRLLDTTTSLDSLFQDIRSNPKKYINIKIF